MQSLISIFALSRPRFWTYLAGPFLIGFVFVAFPQDLMRPVFWYGLFYFLIPANIFLYGINDWFDRDTDRFSEKKKGRELVASEKNLGAYKIAVISALLLAIPLFILLSSLGKIMFAIFLFLSYAYSAPPLRFKARPFLDFLSNILYFVPGLIGFAETMGTLPAWQLILGLSLWPMAMHLFSAIPDIESDRESGIHTSAVSLGKTWSLVLVTALWTGTAFVASHVVGRPYVFLAWLYPVISLLLLLGFGKIEKVYWYFPIINGLIGFILFLYAIDANISF